MSSKYMSTDLVAVTILRGESIRLADIMIIVVMMMTRFAGQC